jgi:hypothetical protein
MERSPLKFSVMSSSLRFVGDNKRRTLARYLGYTGVDFVKYGKKIMVLSDLRDTNWPFWPICGIFAIIHQKGWRSAPPQVIFSLGPIRTNTMLVELYLIDHVVMTMCLHMLPCPP